MSGPNLAETKHVLFRPQMILISHVNKLGSDSQPVSDDTFVMKEVDYFMMRFDRCSGESVSRITDLDGQRN